MTTTTARRRRALIREALILPGIFAFIIASVAAVEFWWPLGIIPAAIIIGVLVKVSR